MNKKNQINECLKIISEILNTNKNIPIDIWVVSFLSSIFSIHEKLEIPFSVVKKFLIDGIEKVETVYKEKK